jgi:O-antigen ligase
MNKIYRYTTNKNYQSGKLSLIKLISNFIKRRTPGNVFAFVIYILLSLSCSVILGVAKNNALLVFIPPFLILALYYMFKFPEITFALFLNAGIYKADPRLDFLPGFFDFTVLFSAITILGIIIRIITKKIRTIFIPAKLLVPYMFMTIMYTISIIYTPAPIYGSDKLLRFLTFTTLSTFAPLFLFQDEKQIKRFFILYILFTIAMAFDLGTRLFQKQVETTFLMAFGGGRLAMGRLAGETSIILCFYFLLSVKNKLLKIILIGLIILSVFVNFSSGSRGSGIGLAIAFMGVIIYTILRIAKFKMSLFNRIKIEDRRIFVTIIFMLISFAFILIRFHDNFLTFFMRTQSLLQSPEEVSSERIYGFNKVFEALSTFPSALIGLGIGGFSVFAWGVDQRYFAHNIFLDIGGDIGIFGIIAFSFLLYSVFKDILTILKKAKADKYFMGITISSMFLFMLFFASIHGEVNDCRFLFAYISLVFAYKRFIINNMLSQNFVDRFLIKRGTRIE